MFRYRKEDSQARQLDGDPSAVSHLGVFAGVLAFSLALGVLPRTADAAWDDEEIPFDEAEIFFELNNTDGDLGIHALIDGEPWKRLEIEDPNERDAQRPGEGRLRSRA